MNRIIIEEYKYEYTLTINNEFSKGGNVGRVGPHKAHTTRADSPHTLYADCKHWPVPHIPQSAGPRDGPLFFNFYFYFYDKIFNV